MKSGEILFFVIISLTVLGIIATIIDSWWQGRKERKWKIEQKQGK